MEKREEEPLIVKKNRPKRRIAEKKQKTSTKPGEKTPTSIFISELISALALIGGGVLLAHYAEDISAYVGDKVQEFADSVFSD